MDRPSAPTARPRLRVSTGPDETRAIGRRIGEAAVPGTVLALIGPLGAGKTQLAKGIAEGLGVTGVVNSPTFVLMNEHPGRLRLYHIDAYRLVDPEEAAAAGLLDERQGDGVTVVEWADRLDGWLPVERLEIRLEMPTAAPTHRTLRWTAHGPAHDRLAGEALDAA
ncbi:MAG: tRNA (adenosine(37)-N6)-threonylcarbamoyltransferase complex ATPase subunit type 1 TsaE [Candidatus Limnocylindria bacterium]